MRALTISPSTRTSSPSSALAPVVTTSPLMVTRPASSISSASRREHRPASLMYLFTRMAWCRVPLRAHSHATLEQIQRHRRQAHHKGDHHHEGNADLHVADAQHAVAECIDHVEDRV